MKTFKQNIIGVFGDEGERWLKALPDIVKKIAIDWNLSDLKPANNLSYSYVLSGFRGVEPIILKLTPDHIRLRIEIDALKALQNYGSAGVLKQKEGAVLLTRAVPGYSLKKYFPSKEKEAVQVACNVIKRLRQAPLDNTFPKIDEWLLILDKDWNIPMNYLQKARTLKNELLSTTKEVALLHGDLHHENILRDGDDWMVIDPKGVIGDRTHGVTVFIYNPIPQLLDAEDAFDIMTSRINEFASCLELSSERIRKWCFVQSVLSWIWCIQSNLDGDYYRRLTGIFDKLVRG